MKAYLDSRTHIPTDVVGLRGMGEKDPVVTGCQPESQSKNKRKAEMATMAKNRRAEIEFEFHQWCLS